MYNGFHLPNNNLNVQVFQPIGGTIQPWRKPAGAKLIHIVCIGGGGGGGGGFTRASGVAGGGGGGGGSSAITRMTIDASLCPDMLYIAVGMGGAGGAANTAGSTGGFSAVYIPLTSGWSGTGTILCTSGNAVAGGGGAGTGAVGGAAGAASTIAVSPTWGSLGTWTSIAGQAGGAGGAITGAVATHVAWGTLFISGGAGGGGVSAANVTAFGSNITGPAGNSLISTITGGTLSTDGKPGYDNWGQPPLSTGGSGGGAGGTGIGGGGGNGGFGSGGAGGGAGTVGGRGGDGGGGRVIITCI